MQLMSMALCAVSLHPSASDELESVVRRLIIRLSGWNHVHTLLRYRRNLYDAQPHKLYIERAQLEERLLEKWAAYAGSDHTIYGL